MGHTHTALALLGDMPAKLVSDVRHGQIGITLYRYSHVLPTMRERVGAVGKVLFGKCCPLGYQFKCQNGEAATGA